MGFLLGSSCFLQSFLFPPSSQSLSLPPHRKPARKKALAVASLHGDIPVDGVAPPHRRAFLLVGISVLPFLQLRAIAAAEELFIGGRRRNRLRNRNSEAAVINNEREQGKSMETQKENKEGIGKPEAQDPKQPEQEISPQEVHQPDGEVHVQNAPGNPFISLLNELGIIGSGVLGALYAISQKEKTAMESTIESMKTRLTEKEAATALLKENFETRLLSEQEERRKQARRLKEEEASLSNQLASANVTIASSRQELQTEKKLTGELKAKMSQLEHGIIQAGEDRKMLEAKIKEKMDANDVLQGKVSLLSLEINDKEKSIECISSSLVEKESEYKNLISIFDQTKADLAEANSIVEQSKGEIFKARGELHSKESSIEDLNDKIRSLHAEKNKTERKLNDLIGEYNDLKSSSERKSAFDAELLSKKDDQLHQLEEGLGLALSEASANQAVIAELAKERDSVQALLEEEVENMRKLKDELQTTRQTLGASRLEASNMSKELEVAKRSYEELVSKVSKIQDEFYEAKKLLSSNLDKEKSALKVVSDELASVEEVLNLTKEELSVTSNELKAVMVDRESLKKELLEVYKKVETTVHELKEERKVAATLNRDLEVLRKQMLKDSEARRALESDLDEATKSLDEMNKSALSLSKELENANSRTVGLETEKEMLFKSLVEQKNIVKEAQENVEDAQNLIMSLGGERESLEKRSKRLEEELVAAKGEILRSRRRISMSKTNEVGAAAFDVKKAAIKRRKGGSAVSENS